MANELVSNQQDKEAELVSHVDAVTRGRIAAFCAHDLSDIKIAEILLLDPETVAACHGTEEFKKKYSEIAEQEINKQLDLDEGWDAVETAGIEMVLETLKFALAAAAMANRANRSKQKKVSDPRTIDASQTGQSNVIILKMTKNYISNVTQNDNRTLTVEQQAIDLSVKKRQDLPNPKHVAEMLAPVQSIVKTPLNEMEEMFQAAGVVFDKDE